MPRPASAAGWPAPAPGCHQERRPRARRPRTRAATSAPGHGASPRRRPARRRATAAPRTGRRAATPAARVGRGSLLILAVFHVWFDIATTSPLGPEFLPTAMGVAVTLVGLILLRGLLQVPWTPEPATPTATPGD